jgi:hypothetical protein
MNDVFVYRENPYPTDGYAIDIEVCRQGQQSGPWSYKFLSQENFVAKYKGHLSPYILAVIRDQYVGNEKFKWSLRLK